MRTLVAALALLAFLLPARDASLGNISGRLERGRTWPVPAVNAADFKPFGFGPPDARIRRATSIRDPRCRLLVLRTRAP
jgi:hypothetical protein